MKIYDLIINEENEVEVVKGGTIYKMYKSIFGKDIEEKEFKAFFMPLCIFRTTKTNYENNKEKFNEFRKKEYERQSRLAEEE